MPRWVVGVTFGGAFPCGGCGDAQGLRPCMHSYLHGDLLAIPGLPGQGVAGQTLGLF